MVGAAAGLAGVMLLIWTLSWLGNWVLAGNVERSVAAAEQGSSKLSLANLQTLDALRVQLEDWDKNDTLRLHWGLYEGDALKEVALRAYFARLKVLSLDLLHQNLTSHLQRAVSEAQPAGITYDRLKVYRTISVLACPADAPLVSKVLKSSAAEVHSGAGEEQLNLLQVQLDFYARQLEKSSKPPVQLAESPIATGSARGYLSSAGGLEQQLRSIINQLNQQVKSVKVADNVDDYRSVLKGNPEVPGAFTKKGSELFDELAARMGDASGETCVVGAKDKAQAAVEALDSQSRDRLKSLYLRQYADAWKDFLASYSVIRFATAEDAAGRLAKLSAPSSPLLGVVKLVALNTSFPQAKAAEPGLLERSANALGTLVPNAKDKALKAKASLDQIRNGSAEVLTPASVSRIFQPVLVTTPPDVDHFVSDNNSPYVGGLRNLQLGVEQLSRASTAEKMGASVQARAAVSQARIAHAGLADKFSNAGSEGVGKQLSDLLLQPIQWADAVIPDSVKIGTAPHNGELAKFCAEIRPTLAKYPFNSLEIEREVDLNELAGLFQPVTGKVWKYVAEHGSDLVVKSQVPGSGWQAKPDLQGVKVTTELIAFLNRSQQLTDVLFNASGNLQPRVKYVLRPVLIPGQTARTRLLIDGTELDSGKSALQVTFYWPAGPGVKRGAEGYQDFPGAGSSGFANYPTMWGVFRLFQYADPRPPGQLQVQWSEVRGGGPAAQRQLITPPARVEFLELPAGVDLFNPHFFEELRCPSRAVLAN
jgi:type VI protein secretion system component VasK